jgi:hypothetical protein
MNITAFVEDELEALLQSVFSEDERTLETMARHNGFNCKSREKLDDIAADIGVTKEAIRQRSIKGIDHLVEELMEREKSEEVIPASRFSTGFLNVVAPCLEKDAQQYLYDEGLTKRTDLDIESLIYLTDALSYPSGLELVKEGEARFLVKSGKPGVIRSIIKKAREDVTSQGAGEIISLAKYVSSGHQRVDNQIRCVVAALEAQSDFVWLTEDYMEGGTVPQRVGHFLLKDAGRNPVELRLKRIFSVREKCHEKWLHAKIARSRKAMKREMLLPAVAISRIGVEKGICKQDVNDPRVFVRATELKPEEELAEFEHQIWEYLRDHPKSRDGDIMEACSRREEDQYNIRSKLNFSVVIQRVQHGVYTAVTDDYPDIGETSIAPPDKRGPGRRATA